MQHLLSSFAGQPWALEPAAMLAAEVLLARWGAGVKLPTAEIEAAVGGAPRLVAQRRQQATASSAEGVAVVPVYGVLVHRAFSVEQLSTPLTSTERLAGEIERIAARPDVRTIILDVDSPGGSVFGVQELGETLARVRATSGKRLVAVANNMAASGAYWIASQAQELVITPSGMVGSIGVIVPHVNRAGLYEKAGIRREYVTAGKYKAEGHDGGPLDDAARAALQSMVDTYYAAFTKAVAAGRGVPVETVRGPGFGQGRMRLAREAVQAGMADAVATLDQTIARHASGARVPIGAERRRFDGRMADIAIAELR